MSFKACLYELLTSIHCIFRYELNIRRAVLHRSVSLTTAPESESLHRQSLLYVLNDQSETADQTPDSTPRRRIHLHKNENFRGLRGEWSINVGTNWLRTSLCQWEKASRKWVLPYRTRVLHYCTGPVIHFHLQQALSRGFVQRYYTTCQPCEGILPNVLSSTAGSLLVQSAGVLCRDLIARWNESVEFSSYNDHTPSENSTTKPDIKQLHVAVSI
jgi:hypothetical protein